MDWIAGESVLLFDFGGTLDADGVPWADRFFDSYRTAGGRTALASFRRVFAESDEQLARLPGILEFDFSHTVVAQSALLARLLPEDADLPWDRIAGEFIDAACTTAARNHGTLAALGRQRPLAVISNFQGNLEPCLDELGLLDLFTVVADSAVVGIRKPDPDIFRRVLAELGAAAAGSWMIGDSPPADIAPALALGLQGCWIAPEARPLPEIVPSARIARLTDLPSALATACTH